MERELNHETAKQLALEQLGGLQPEDLPPVEPAIIDAETIERPGGWVFFWNTRLYVETGDLEHALVGPGPIYVRRQDGSVSSLVSAEPIDREIRRHERRIGVRPWWKLW